jgi:hypothetical protein
VHLVGFIIRICHDAWSSECQIVVAECQIVVAECQIVVAECQMLLNVR